MELNEKLGKWRWPDSEITVHPVDKTIWVSADTIYETKLFGWFTLSIDACFKWLVPEILNKYSKDTVEQMLGHWVFWLVYGRITEPAEPALALCKAIEQMIKEESCQKE